MADPRAADDRLPRIHRMIADSARGLCANEYLLEQFDVLIEHVLGVDSQLITDRAYYVIERGRRTSGLRGLEQAPRALFLRSDEA